MIPFFLPATSFLQLSTPENKRAMLNPYAILTGVLPCLSPFFPLIPFLISSRHFLSPLHQCTKSLALLIKMDYILCWNIWGSWKKKSGFLEAPLPYYFQFHTRCSVVFSLFWTLFLLCLVLFLTFANGGGRGKGPRTVPVD